MRRQMRKAVGQYQFDNISWVFLHGPSLKELFKSTLRPTAVHTRPYHSLQELGSSFWFAKVAYISPSNSATRV
jgi:hypothetical protein